MGSQNKRRVVFADDDARPCPKDLGHKFGRTPRDHLSIPPHESINERTILGLSLSLRVAAPPPAAFVPSTVTVSRVFTTCKPVRACTIKRIDTSVDIGRGATVWLGETTLCGALFSCLEESGPDGRRHCTSGAGRLPSAIQLRRPCYQERGGRIPAIKITHLGIVNVNNPLHLGKTRLSLRLDVGKSVDPVDDDIRKECIKATYKVASTVADNLLP